MSSNTNIGNTPVNQGYVQLIHTGETGGIDGTLRTLYDGDGTASDLQIASNKVKVSTELFIGSDTLQEYIQDTVGAMLVTNASHTNLSAAYDDAGDGAIDLTASGDVTLSNSVTLSNKTLAAPTLTGTTQGASITLSGDLTVNGTTTTVNQTNLDVSDNIIGLNRGASTNANDSGLIIERGSTGNNAAIIWDESEDKFTLGTTTAIPSDTGNLTITTGTLVAALEGNADTATKIASITNSDIVQLTSSQTLTNKTLASPTFTGDIDFSDASTPQLNITDTTNTITTRVASSNSNGTVGTVTDHNLNIIRNSVAHFNLFGAYTMHNNGGNDLDFRAKDSSGNVVFKVDAGDSKTHITTLKLDSVSISAIQTGSESFADNDTSLMTSAAIQDKIQSFGYITSVGIDEILAADIIDSTEAFSDSDDLLMTAKAINDRIESFGYGTGNGDMTGVSITASDPLDISQSNTTSGNYSATISLDASEFGSYLADMTDQASGTDELAILDSGTLKRKAINGIRLTEFDATGFSAGISFDGSTANGVLTFKDSDEATVEANLTFDGNHLDITSGHLVLPYGEINDAGTDLNIVGTNAVTLQSSAGTALTIPNASTNVGIGTSSPQNKLHVDATTSSNVVARFNTDSTFTFIDLYNDDSNRVQIGNADDGDFIIRTNDAERFRVDKTTGNCGIGTTHPDTKLDITAGGANGVVINQDSNDATNSARMFFKNSSGTYSMYKVGDYLRVNSGATAGSSSGGTNLISIGSNVGIGETSPEAKLHIKNASAGTFTASNSQLLIENNTTVRLSMVTPTSNASKIEFGDVDDQDAGILEYNNSDNSMRFTTNTSEAMRINSSGNVGIGVNSPSVELHVKDASSHAQLRIETDSASHGAYLELEGSANKYQIYNVGGDLGIDEAGVATRLIIKDSTGHIQLPNDLQAIEFGAGQDGRIYSYEDDLYIVNQTAGQDIIFRNLKSDSSAYVDNLFIDGSAQRVGIGTTSPSEKLDVVGSAEINGLLYVSDSNDIPVRLSSTDAGFAISMADSNSASATHNRIGVTTNDMTFHTNNTEAMRIDSSQNVGIGTDNPSSLDANGNRLVIGGGSGNEGLTIFSGTSGLGTMLFADGNDGSNAEYRGWIQYEHANDSLEFATASAERVRIDSSGNVGIGTDSPNMKLNISHGDQDGIRLNCTSTTGEAFIDFGDSGDNDAGSLRYDHNDNSMRFRVNASERARILNTGAFHVTNDVVAFSSTPSDKKLKTNVKDIDYGLNTIMKLNPKQYDWKKDNRHDIGFIAQEVEEVIPEIVKDNEWFDDKIKTMDYEKLTAVLIKAVQEQQEQINKLEEKLNG